MKKVLLMSLAASALLFAGCSNKNLDIEAEKSNLEVVFKVPQGTQPRGIVEDPVAATPVLKSATIYVLKNGGGVVDQKNITFTGEEYNNEYKVTFEAIALSGNEKVLVTANVSGDGEETSEQSFQGNEVAKIQPTGTNPGLKNVYYRGEATISESSRPGNNDGHDVYEAQIDVLPIAARVEIIGNVKYNTELVTDLYVSVVTPNMYTNTYGAMEKFAPKTTSKGSLWLDVTTDNYETDILTGGKAIANHLFAGDEQRIAFQINATVYKFKTDDQGKAIIIEVADRNIKSYIFTDGAADYVKDRAGSYYKYSVNAAGQSVIAEDAEATDPILATYKTVTSEKGGFFNMVNFRKTEDNSEIHNGKYEAGYIYKIDFAEIDWNNDGVIDDKDIYNPGENGGGTEEPTSAADLIVYAKVVDWVPVNVFPGIE